MSPEWVQFALGAIGAGGVVFTVFRGRHQDSDARIDERIKLAVGVDLAKIQADISAIRTALPHELSAVLVRVDIDVKRHSQEIEELFRRLREHELKGA